MYDAGIEAFLAIIEARNLKKAGEMLSLTQATISYRLKILEQEMGAQLIERNKGIQQITLTAFGESFIPIANRWYLLKADMEKLQRQWLSTLSCYWRFKQSQHIRTAVTLPGFKPACAENQSDFSYAALIRTLGSNGTS